MGQFGRIKPIHATIAAAGVLLLLGAFLLLRSSPVPKAAVTSTAPPVVAPLTPPLALPVAVPEPTEAKAAQHAHRSARPKQQKWVDPFAGGESNKPNPFTGGESDKPTQTTTPRRKAKKKLFEEL